MSLTGIISSWEETWRLAGIFRQIWDVSEMVMEFKKSKVRKSSRGKMSREEMDQVVRKARQAQDDRLRGYREQSLRIHPWICARCSREFSSKNLHLLTVHHKDHDHDNNPPDGSNWENLCIYCHENEHRRYLDHVAGKDVEMTEEETAPVTHKPFAALADMLKQKKE